MKGWPRALSGVIRCSWSSSSIRFKRSTNSCRSTMSAICSTGSRLKSWFSWRQHRTDATVILKQRGCNVVFGKTTDEQIFNAKNSTQWWLHIHYSSGKSNVQTPVQYIVMQGNWRFEFKLFQQLQISSWLQPQHPKRTVTARETKRNSRLPKQSVAYLGILTRTHLVLGIGAEREAWWRQKSEKFTKKLVFLLKKKNTFQGTVAELHLVIFY